MNDFRDNKKPRFPAFLAFLLLMSILVCGVLCVFSLIEKNGAKKLPQNTLAAKNYASQILKTTEELKGKRTLTVEDETHLIGEVDQLSKLTELAWDKAPWHHKKEISVLARDRFFDGKLVDDMRPARETLVKLNKSLADGDIKKSSEPNYLSLEAIQGELNTVKSHLGNATDTADFPKRRRGIFTWAFRGLLLASLLSLLLYFLLINAHASRKKQYEEIQHLESMRDESSNQAGTHKSQKRSEKDAKKTGDKSWEVGNVPESRKPPFNDLDVVENKKTVPAVKTEEKGLKVIKEKEARKKAPTTEEDPFLSEKEVKVEESAQSDIGFNNPFTSKAAAATATVATAATAVTASKSVSKNTTEDIPIIGLFSGFFKDNQASEEEVKSQPSTSAAKTTPKTVNTEENEGEKDKEIQRLKGLLGTLFNDRARELCIADEQGGILMQNDAFKENLGRGKEVDSLTSVLGKQLSHEDYKKAFSSFQDFFSLPENKQSEGLSLENLKFADKDLPQRVTFQPFPAKDGELCSLVSFQDTPSKSTIEKATYKKPATGELYEKNASEASDGGASSLNNDPSKENQKDKESQKENGEPLKTAGSSSSTRQPSSLSPLKTATAATAGGATILGARAAGTASKKKEAPITSQKKEAGEAEGGKQESTVSSSVLIAPLNELSYKHALLNDKEIRLDTDAFDESLIPDDIKPAILDVLTQGIKLSIQHSVEPASVREKRQKEKAATLTLSNWKDEKIPILRKPGMIIKFTDDGRGLDPETFYEIAKKAKLTHKSSAAELTKDEIVSLLFHEKFKLPKKYNFDIENLVKLREVGMKKLNGKLQFSYTEDKYLSFQILIPDES